MKLVIFNGSPRYKKSNSKILIEHFLSGYNKICSEPVPVHYLANRKQKDEQIGFVVQSGFPEAIHSIYLERYLEKLTKRLQCEYLGTIIKGGVEGIQMMPSSMTKKLFGRFESLGEYFAKNEAFSPEIKKILRKPFKMSPVRIFLFKLMSKTGLTNFYWNSNLKKNNAFSKRFDKPFEGESNSTHFV